MAIKKLTRYRWEYISDMEYSGPGSIKIKPPEEVKRPIPDSLYKYYPLNKNTISAITEGYLYGSNPYQLNDIFDCSEFLINYDNIDAVKYIFHGILDEKEIERGFELNDQGFFRKIQYNLNILIYSRIGLLSFTGDHLSIPMWSYYTGNEGVVVEFDYKKFDFLYYGPFPINYQADIKPASINDGLELCFLYQSNVKTIEWQHENEWRILADQQKPMLMEGIPLPENAKPADRKFNYTISCIKRIIFGNRFFKQLFKELKVNPNGTVNIDFKENADLKNQLIDFILKQHIPTYIITKTFSGFNLSEAPCVVKEDRTIEIKFIEPIDMNK